MYNIIRLSGERLRGSILGHVQRGRRSEPLCPGLPRLHRTVEATAEVWTIPANMADELPVRRVQLWLVF